MSVCSNTGCTGCPHCCSEMADILRDSVHGRVQALSAKLTAMTERHVRVLGASPRHPALRFSGGTVPPAPDLGAAISERRTPSTAPGDRLQSTLSERSPIGPAPAYPPSTSTIAPPCLGDAIKQHRSK